jgi:hypothetical protein
VSNLKTCHVQLTLAFWPHLHPITYCSSSPFALSQFHSLQFSCLTQHVSVQCSDSMDQTGRKNGNKTFLELSNDDCQMVMKSYLPSPMLLQKCY